MKPFSFKNIWHVLKLSGKDFVNNNVSKLSAALAYYTIFSLPGMLMIVITLGSFFYGKEAIEGTVQHQISGFVGDKAALQIQELVRNAAISNENTLAAIVGIATLVYGATKMFSEIQNSLNLIWNLKAKPKRGWVKMIINRLLSFSMVLCIGFLLLVSLVINGIVAMFSSRLAVYFPQVTISVVYVFNLILTFIITVALFTLIFKVLPDAMIRWRDVLVGAIATALLFMIGKFVIGLYMGKSDVASTYGAAGSIIVILLWIYYCAIILYFGAAFTKQYAQKMGYHIYPTDAVWIKEVEVEGNQPLQEIEKAAKEGRIVPNSEKKNENP